MCLETVSFTSSCSFTYTQLSGWGGHHIVDVKQCLCVVGPSARNELFSALGLGKVSVEVETMILSCLISSHPQPSDKNWQKKLGWKSLLEIRSLCYLCSSRCIGTHYIDRAGWSQTHISTCLLIPDFWFSSVMFFWIPEWNIPRKDQIHIGSQLFLLDTSMRMFITGKSASLLVFNHTIYSTYSI